MRHTLRPCNSYCNRCLTLICTCSGAESEEPVKSGDEGTDDKVSKEDAESAEKHKEYPNPE